MFDLYILNNNNDVSPLDTHLTNPPPIRPTPHLTHPFTQVPTFTNLHQPIFVNVTQQPPLAPRTSHHKMVGSRFEFLDVYIDQRLATLDFTYFL